ncbi:metallophosphoesterase [Alkalihalobacillus sp. BA299]|uniref:metallophosphoesterase n=1 Tax=Alkalihalobacillus sp. BA299 TaxID=2815938 RepID=UPI001ADB6136|nr:metallophosphoesterase [Alkalihalobacillus sp. BA299]
MRFGFIADLHIDINKKRKRGDVLDVLLAQTSEQKLDVLCIGGDVSNDYKETLATVERIEQELKMPCYFVAGNHDLWNIHYPSMKTWDIYNDLKSHPRNLANGPQQLTENWVLLGDIGWYDFSFGNYKKYTVNDFIRMKMKGSTWQDKEYTDWADHAVEIHNLFLSSFKEQLVKNENKKIIFCTHVVSHHLFTVPTPHRIWDYFNAFLGSGEYERLASTTNNVRYALCGHVHFRKKVQNNNTQFICSSLGYANQWRSNETKKEMQHALTVLHLDER